MLVVHDLLLAAPQVSTKGDNSSERGWASSGTQLTQPRRWPKLTWYAGTSLPIEKIPKALRVAI